MILASAMINKSALKESLLDVSVGLLIAFPVSFVTLYIAQRLSLDIAETTLLQVCVFTILAIIRKYLIRINFQ